MTTIDSLYENYEKLSKATAEVDEQCDIYLSFIAATNNSDSSVRRLASQFISQFYADFPEYHEQSMKAQIKLVEEKDGQIRRQAMKVLPQMCVESLPLVSRAAFVISQVFSSSDKLDISLASSCLLELREINFMSCLHGIFMAMKMSGNGAPMYNNVVMFFCDRFMQNLPDNNQFSFYDLELIKIKLDGVYSKLTTLNLFRICTSFLGTSSLKPIHNRIVDIILQRIGVDNNFDCNNDNFMKTLQQGVAICEKLFTKSLKSNKLVEFLIFSLIPKYLVIASKGGDKFTNSCQLSKLEKQSSHFVAILKSLVNILLTKYDFTDNTADMISIVIYSLEYYMPETTDSTNLGYSINCGTSFEAIECMLFILHTLIKNTCITNNASILAKLLTLKNKKLLYFNKVNNYNNKQVLMGKISGDIAANANITSIIKDLCSLKVVCKTDLKPSFNYKKKDVLVKNAKKVVPKSPAGKVAKKEKAKENGDSQVSSKKFKTIVF